ncbi:outer membrane lipoprotein carrier protein LolA [Sphingomonas sp. LY54]|uniref:LolA family protein n=1 Tax=Sphingomonas sp. LY54 TaxID=3095343 RepID=UPI002D77AFFD|nr:outer membrane lipoprotein carrier protein LolA [Sphingomonas sp. LY54]WRP27346.1 outer membrane lipoprotein carrier protein LolA [Sphingomonas sp. LY54]
MLRFTTLALAAVPLTIASVTPATAAAQAASPLNQVTQHLRAVDTMTANFVQTDRKGQSLGGTLTMKRPGKIRFQYQKGVPLLIVGDGKALTMIDYEVKQVSRWPIGNSPLSVLLNPDKKLDGIAKVVTNNDQVLMIQARDPKKPEFGTISIAFAKIGSAPQGLMLQGWTTIDAQNNRTTIKLSNQRFNVAVAESAFRWTDPRRKGPRG